MCVIMNFIISVVAFMLIIDSNSIKTAGGYVLVFIAMFCGFMSGYVYVRKATHKILCIVAFCLTGGIGFAIFDSPTISSFQGYLLSILAFCCSFTFGYFCPDFKKG